MGSVAEDPQNALDEVKQTVSDLGQANYDFYRGLYTLDYGRSRDAITDAGVSAGQLTGLVDRPQENGAPPVVKGEPTRGSANMEALGRERRDLRRRAASATLLTGGSGILDQPSSASNILMGV